MKARTILPLIGILLLTVISPYAQEAKISVLSPRGTPPPIPLVPMAPRLESLKGKTVYFIDVGYEGGASLLRVIMNWFSKNMPETKLVFRKKKGTYDQEDSRLWAEVKDKGDAVVMAVGH